MSDKIDKQIEKFSEDLYFVKQAPIECNSPKALQDLFYDSARMLETVRKVYKLCEKRLKDSTEEKYMAKKIKSIMEEELNAEVGGKNAKNN